METLSPESMEWLHRRCLGWYSLVGSELLAQLWLDWNERCDAQAGMQVRIEDMPEQWPEVAAWLGFRTAVAPGAYRIPRDLNARPHGPRPAWADLGIMQHLVRERAEEYGYACA